MARMMALRTSLCTSFPRSCRIEDTPYFNSRPSARGDLSWILVPHMFIFQFTPLREGRRRSGIAATARILFQFTPLREGRRLAALCCACADVSISIHAPPRGATPQARTAASIMAYFNSRPSARGDVMKQVAMWDDYKFQFTPLREGRPGITLACKPHALVFQFTPLREGRRCRRTGDRGGRHFNSRPSARGDGSWRRFNPPDDISIHAPPRGAT